MEELGGQPIGAVDHSRGAQALLSQSKDDILACLGTKLTLEDVLMLSEVRLEVPLLSGEDSLLTLQEL